LPLPPRHHSLPDRCIRGADPQLVGRTIRLNGHPFSIVGITPRSFFGKPQSFISALGYYLDPRLSPDGGRLAVSTQDASGGIVIYDSERATPLKLTFDGFLKRSHVWTPDGKHIVYESHLEAGDALMWIRADGGGEPQLLRQSPTIIVPHSFSPDGKRLAFEEWDAGTGYDLWTLPLDTRDPDHPRCGNPEILLRTPASEMLPAISPDGKWIAYESNESGNWEIYVRPFVSGSAASAGKWQVSTGEGHYYQVWSRAARQLFYQAFASQPGATDGIMVVDYTVEGDSFHAGRPRRWTDKPLHFGNGQNFDVAPDGKRIALLLREPADEPKGNLHLTLLLNWFDEVQRRMSSGP
jgi:serine/threonine-protein kinase